MKYHIYKVIDNKVRCIEKLSKEAKDFEITTFPIVPKEGMYFEYSNDVITMLEREEYLEEENKITDFSEASLESIAKQLYAENQLLKESNRNIKIVMGIVIIMLIIIPLLAMFYSRSIYLYY